MRTPTPTDDGLPAERVPEWLINVEPRTVDVGVPFEEAVWQSEIATQTPREASAQFGVVPAMATQTNEEVAAQIGGVPGVCTQTPNHTQVQTTETPAIATQTKSHQHAGLQADVPADRFQQTGEGDPVLSAPFPNLQFAPRYRVMFRGRKQFHALNRLPLEEGDRLPMFAYEPKQPKLAPIISKTGPCSRRKLLKDFETDSDLVYVLKMDAAFQQRSVSLLLQLKQKARKWLAGWDMSAYTSQQIYEMAMKAIGQAMLVDEWEEKIRALLHMREERKYVRPAQNSFLVAGKTGSNDGSCLDRQRGKRTACWGVLWRRLTRATRF